MPHTVLHRKIKTRQRLAGFLMVMLNKYLMRQWINIVEEQQPLVLYHGTSLDDLHQIIHDGIIRHDYMSDTHFNGVSLSRNFKVSFDHAKSDEENMTYSFYEYFGLDGYENYKKFGGAVLAFDRSAIEQKLEDVDDMGGDIEEEERTHGSLPLKPGLVAIYLSKAGLQLYISEVNRARQLSDEAKTAYDTGWDTVMRFLTTSPMVKDYSDA